MAIQWMDNFSAYGLDEALMLNGAAYASNSGTLIADPDPDAVGSTVIRLSGNSETRKILNTPRQTLGAAGRVWLSELSPGVVVCPFIFKDVANNIHLAVGIDTNGYMVAYRGNPNSGVLLGSSAGPVIVANGWQHVETRVVIDNTVGEVEVRVEGVPVLELTGVDTQIHASNSSAYSVSIFYPSAGTSINMYVKDYVIWDTDGAYINDFIGTCSVFTVGVTADDAFNWTASSGATGFNLIDEAPPVDTDYISASDAPPAASVFALADLPVDVIGVRGLMMMGRMRKTDSGDANVRMSMVSGVSEFNGTDRPITVAFSYWTDVSHFDPATNVAWTRVGVNSAKIKVNRTV